MIKYHPSSNPQNPLAQIFAIQGHPEFTPAIVSHIVDRRSAAGIFDASATTEARRRLGGKDGSGGEGLGRVGWAIWRVLLQDLPVHVVSNGNGDFHLNGSVNGNGEWSSTATRRYVEDESRYAHVDKVLDRKGPWTVEQFPAGMTVSSLLKRSVSS
jgi:hypothetical protein